MHKNTFVVAGIGTEVGKTVVSAVVAQALEAEYWKPVQAGELEYTDTHKVEEYVSNSEFRVYPESYALLEPMSPHAAAERESIDIKLEEITIPHTDNPLIIELAGGLMVPLNPSTLNIDLLETWNLPVILVANYYLGSINHTLLSIELLKQRKIPIAGIVFSGHKNQESHDVILAYSGLKCLLEIDQEENVDQEMIKKYANRFSI